MYLFIDGKLAFMNDLSVLEAGYKNFTYRATQVVMASTQEVIGARKGHVTEL